jgi:hypothetical protein
MRASLCAREREKEEKEYRLLHQLEAEVTFSIAVTFVLLFITTEEHVEQ